MDPVTDRRERILEAVAPVFAAEGFAGASTRALGAAAGVNVSTLAYHFGGKQGLYDALVDRTYEHLLAVSVTVPGGTREARVRALVARLWSFARAHRVEVRVLLRHVIDRRRLPEALRARWLTPLLARAGEALATLELAPTPENLLRLQSLQHLVVRWAIAEEDEFGLVPGGEDAVEAHLAGVAGRVLGIAEDPKRRRGRK